MITPIGVRVHPVFQMERAPPDHWTAWIIPPFQPTSSVNRLAFSQTPKGGLLRHERTTFTPN